MTEDGVADPQQEERESQPTWAGIRLRARDGSRLAETTGSVHDSPTRMGCTKPEFYLPSCPAPGEVALRAVHRFGHAMLDPRAMANLLIIKKKREPIVDFVQYRVASGDLLSYADCYTIFG